MSHIEWHVKDDTGVTVARIDNEPGANRLRDHWNAVAWFKCKAWRVARVRILTPAESRRKAAAEALRELAVELRADMKYWPPFDVSRDVIKKMAKKAEEKADALWPRKGAGR